MEEASLASGLASGLAAASERPPVAVAATAGPENPVVGAASAQPEVLDSFWLGPEPEDTVLKEGLLTVQEALSSQGVLNFPLRDSGEPLLIRQGFFERLLRGETTLKDSPVSDVSAAQADVKHLTLEQLLTIRCRHFDNVEAGPKASFVQLLDRCAMKLLEQRLLGDEPIPADVRNSVTRQALLVFGASRRVPSTDTSSSPKGWWLVAVSSTRRFLSLQRCELSSTPPTCPAYCYRSRSRADPRAANRATVFRWQVLLVSNPWHWTEDPITGGHLSQATPAEVRLEAKLPKVALPNVVDLFEQAEKELDAMFGTSLGEEPSPIEIPLGNGGSSDMHGDQVLTSLWLGPEPEERVLKEGLLGLVTSLGDAGLLTFPRRPNGTPLLMRQGFFERLLQGEASLQSTPAADVSAAQTDIGHLKLNQLLAIRCRHFRPVETGAKSTFIDLLDRCIMTRVDKHLLGDEPLPAALRALIMRHAILIYGASRRLKGRGKPLGSNSWLIAVAGTRRYLHLPQCKLKLAPPHGPVYCYRSRSAADPRDPRQSRMFRWQVLLVADPLNWLEDTLLQDQCNRRPRYAKASAAAAADGFSLFGSDVVDLFAQAEEELDTMFQDMTQQASRHTAGDNGAAASAAVPKPLASSTPVAVPAAAQVAGGAAAMAAGTSQASTPEMPKQVFAELAKSIFDEAEDDLEAIFASTRQAVATGALRCGDTGKVYQNGSSEQQHPQAPLDSKPNGTRQQANLKEVQELPLPTRALPELSPQSDQKEEGFKKQEDDEVASPVSQQTSTSAVDESNLHVEVERSAVIGQLITDAEWALEEVFGKEGAVVEEEVPARHASLQAQSPVATEEAWQVRTQPRGTCPAASIDSEHSQGREEQVEPQELGLSGVEAHASCGSQHEDHRDKVFGDLGHDVLEEDLAAIVATEDGEQPPSSHAEADAKNVAAPGSSQGEAVSMDKHIAEVASENDETERLGSGQLPREEPEPMDGTVETDELASGNVDAASDGEAFSQNKQSAEVPCEVDETERLGSDQLLKGERQPVDGMVDADDLASGDDKVDLEGKPQADSVAATKPSDLVLGIPLEMFLLLSASAIIILALLMELLRPFER